MKKGYNHFSISEREKLSLRAMGKKLGRSHTSISDEVKRNSMNGEYSPHKAQILYKQRRNLTGSKHKLLHDTKLKEYIEFKIKEDDWLPDRKFIEERPLETWFRTEIGHWKVI